MNKPHTSACTFWGTHDADAYEVRVNGQIRRDYIAIQDGYGKKGFFFPSLTDDERIQVEVRALPQANYWTTGADFCLGTAFGIVKACDLMASATHIVTPEEHKLLTDLRFTTRGWRRFKLFNRRKA